ncbi:MAG: hypothetical protein J6J01_11265 [Oscillospiraceae bacterium]|nr:hypothetical protein [Oscillospiraceae bacterium]
MKKIVALVLSLVMVLGLATTAFGATFAQGDINAALAVTGSTAEVKAATAAADSVKMFGTYQVYVTDSTTKAVTVYGPFTEVALASQATHTFVDGTNVRYFSTVTNYDKVVKEVKFEKKAVYTCGDYQVNADATYYVDADGVYYKEGLSLTGNLNGKAVGLEECTAEVKALVKDHTYLADSKKVAGEDTITAVNCTVCKKSFAFVDGTVADAVAKFGAGKYTVATGVNGFEGTVYVALDGAASAPAVDGDKVESAETFDAGIAMYVGMSVMAAAGSAVVLKKKD